MYSEVKQNTKVLKTTTKTARQINKIIYSAFMVMTGLIMVLPLFWMISSSFKFEGDVFNMPVEWMPSNGTLFNYKKLLTELPFLRWTGNTLIVTVAVIFLLILISSIAGYSFAKLDFAGKNIMFFLFISTMMIPGQVRIIPQFELYRSIGIINTLWCIILPWSFSAFGIFMMRQFYMSIPDELIESGRIDGASEFGIFFKIVMPLSKAQISALGILSFTWAWNQYMGPLTYIRDTDKQVLSVGIAMLKANYADNIAQQMAGSTLALLPIVVVYLLLQRQFIEGITSSGVKG